MFKEYFTFDDVALVPQYNNIHSRTIPDLRSELAKGVELGSPIVAANMDTVINEDMANALIKNGSIPIFHRFTSFEQQMEWVLQFKNNCFVSCGLKDIDQTVELLNAGAIGVCVDIAHGHSDTMMEYIRELKKRCPNKSVIAGNVCTPVAVHDLANAGADAVKVGIGGGAACSTRIVTGFGCPQFTAIYECAKIAKKLQIPIIADGGIRNSRDVVLALAAGASSVMIGSLFAKTVESPGEKYEKGGIQYKKYRGQASEDFQKDYFGKLKEKTVAEGIHFDVKISGSTDDLMGNLLGGIRSAMTYGGAKTIKELQEKAEFVKVTPNYLAESRPRPEQ